MVFFRLLTRSLTVVFFPLMTRLHLLVSCFSTARLLFMVFFDFLTRLLLLDAIVSCGHELSQCSSCCDVLFGALSTSGLLRPHDSCTFFSVQELSFMQTCLLATNFFVTLTSVIKTRVGVKHEHLTPTKHTTQKHLLRYVSTDSGQALLPDRRSVQSQSRGHNLARLGYIELAH